MARTRRNFDVVRAIGRELPEVEESTMYGAPSGRSRSTISSPS